MNKNSNNVIGAIIALEAIVFGIFIALKMGFSFVPSSTLSYIVTFGGSRHIIGTIAALIFIPVCVKQTRKGFLTIIMFCCCTIILTSISIIDLLFITRGFENKAIVAFIILIFQVMVVMFSFRALRDISKISPHY